MNRIVHKLTLEKFRTNITADLGFSADKFEKTVENQIFKLEVMTKILRKSRRISSARPPPRDADLRHFGTLFPYLSTIFPQLLLFEF